MLLRFVGLFFFLLPFQFALNPVPDIDLALARVWGAGILFWWLARGLAKRKIEFPPLLFTGALLSFLFLALASLLWAENTGFALRKALFLLNFFPLIFVFYDLTREKGVARLWLTFLLGGASLASGVALVVFVSQFVFGVEKVFAWLTESLPFFLGQNLGAAVGQYPSLLVNIQGNTLLRATAFFPDPHVASFFFGLTGFLGLGMWLQSKSHPGSDSKSRKNFYLFVTVLLFLADLLTFSRGGYLGLLAGLFLFGILSWGRMSLKMKKTAGLALAVGLVLFIIFGQGILARFTSSFTFSDTSSTDRLVLWQTALENIKERPFLGTGIGNYILAVNPTADYRAPYYAHNLYLDIATELGLVGLFFFLLLFVLALRYSHNLKIVGVLPENFLGYGVTAALTLYLVHSFFETALYSVHILPLLFFLLSLAYHEDTRYAAAI